MCFKFQRGRILELESELNQMKTKMCAESVFAHILFCVINRKYEEDYHLLAGYAWADNCLWPSERAARAKSNEFELCRVAFEFERSSSELRRCWCEGILWADRGFGCSAAGCPYCWWICRGTHRRSCPYRPESERFHRESKGSNTRWQEDCRLLQKWPSLCKCR